ncbi:hypothetical protein [Blastococcus sp. VKM Ac-2987]|uniref:hypothetical protein n=1 Tax=Blastococcus sp. VKM Ac-2987 TaxID=3004141 RepID=UPI0022ABAFC7|nr:hypothetical protein [Blastococcus sp. VKM Ac-2987]MCZ2858989.1 hypothetical protein [Blastococcus sp. VKM Ac-2987]
MTAPRDVWDLLVVGGGTAGIVGATVVGPRAGETLGELTLAVRKGLTAGDLTGTTHAYPTFNDGAWNAAIAATCGRLATPPARALLGAAVRLRRWQLDRRAARGVSQLPPARSASSFS